MYKYTKIYKNIQEIYKKTQKKSKSSKQMHCVLRVLVYMYTFDMLYIRLTESFI